MINYKYVDDAEEPLTWSDVLGSVALFAIIAMLTLGAYLL